MRNVVRILGMSLVSMAGILLVIGVAWAQASKETVSGQGNTFIVMDNGKVWLDDEGIRHFRNRQTRLRLVGDIEGFQFRIANLNINTVTREADLHGSFKFTGYLFQDLIRATGRFTALCSGTPSICEENSVWHLEDGRKINLTEVYPLDVTGPDTYEGTVLDPPGHR